MDKKKQNIPKSVAIIVAHPDDEVLWVGGTILMNPLWQCFILSLCRKDDADRAPKFYKILKILNANGVMGNLDDEPEQNPLHSEQVDNAIMILLIPKHFDIIITHNPKGEYTRHIRHEEIGKSVMRLWQQHRIVADELWLFAYEDEHKSSYPKPMKEATYTETISETIWLKKYNLITETYGFDADSWEAKTTPKREAFIKFNCRVALAKWLLMHNLKYS